MAVASANVENVRALLHAGANPQLRDAAGRTAEQLAQQLGHTPLVELIRRVRSVRIVSNNILCMASLYGYDYINENLIKLLLNKLKIYLFL